MASEFARLNDSVRATIKAEALHLADDGWAVRKIAAEIKRRHDVDVHHATVARWIKEYGAGKRKRRPATPRVAPIDAPPLSVAGTAVDVSADMRRRYLELQASAERCLHEAENAADSRERAMWIKLHREIVDSIVRLVSAIRDMLGDDAANDYADGLQAMLATLSKGDD